VGNTLSDATTVFSRPDLRLLLVQTIVGEGNAMDASAESVIQDAKVLEAYILDEESDNAA